MLIVYEGLLTSKSNYFHVHGHGDLCGSLKVVSACDNPLGVFYYEPMVMVVQNICVSTQ